MIPLFDLHCDTLYELFKNKQALTYNTLAISMDKAIKFSPYIQVMAIWSEATLSDEDAYKQYNDILRYADSIGISFVHSTKKLSQSSFVLAVEGARLLSNDLSRIRKLYDDGVRILTLNWKWASSIGGAWNTDFPLTDFGKQAVYCCLETGIIPDISHSSYLASCQILDICEEKNKPAISTHSNSFSVCQHPRNLTDCLFLRLISLDSIVGINLCAPHLTSNFSCDVDAILRHIYHFINLGGKKHICLGCDFDGTSSLPDDIRSIYDLDKLYYAIIKEFGEQTAKDIFFFNAYNFFCKYVN